MMWLRACGMEIKSNEQAKDNIYGYTGFCCTLLGGLQAKTEVLAVITQPDRPKGRGHNLQASPVKQKALEYNLPVLQPEKSKPRNLLQSWRNYSRI